MDFNRTHKLLHMAEETIWIKKINDARVDGSICRWISTFHPEKLKCYLEGGFMNGSYNLGQRVFFDDNTTWFFRLPRVSGICPEYADEKVAMEIEALHLIRENTSIPVPKIYAWGRADENPLGLGPFILMEYIDGIPLRKVLGKKEEDDPEPRLLRKDVSNTELEFVYRQMAQIMLQLFKLDFSEIGSLPTPKTKFLAPRRPLTWRGHEIQNLGGVKTHSVWDKGLTSTSEYFEYVLGQDWAQLQLQPNSIPTPDNGKKRYSALKVLKSLIPELVNPAYEKGPFKLICDDFGLANVLVRSETDLTIVGVFDMEWVYAGPAQLFASAPWWLLFDRPVNEAWDYDGDQPPKVTDRYFKCLDIFMRVLEEEETKETGHGQGELNRLMEWSRDTGAMWLHMLLSAAFFEPSTFPCMRLQKHKGDDWWNEKMGLYEDGEEIEAFVASKMKELDAYYDLVDKVEPYNARLENGEMTAEEFIAVVSPLLGPDAGPSRV